jgi:glycosyltransferase involved in cell wall biosynthesis
MPQVSVVIPVYNGAQYILRAIASVQAQTVRDLEIVVVDDGSHDATADLVTAVDDPRVRLIRQANAGPSAARNTGIAAATGEWVAFLDADDRWQPEKLEAQLAAAAREPRAGLVYSATRTVDAAGTVLAHMPITYTGQPLGELLMGNRLTGSASSAMVRRAILAALGGFRVDLRSAEDWDMWLRIVAAHPIVAVPEEHVILQWRPDSHGKHAAQMLDCSLRVLTDAFDGYAAHLRHLRAQAFAEVHYRAAIEFQSEGNGPAERREIRAVLRHRPTFLIAYKRLLRSLLRDLTPGAVRRTVAT